MKKKTLLSWSSGKDSAWSLHVLKNNPDIEIAGLFCTVNQTFGRVAMHAVRVELLELQAERAGLPLEMIEIPYPCSDEQYAAAMSKFIEKAKADGVECFAFGDLYLEDIRKYREDKLAGTGIEPIFPLWQVPTDKLAREMVRGGLKAVITSVDPKQLPEKFAGRIYDESFIKELPATADPCGENGEFHSFVFAGPMFDSEIEITRGEVVSRDGFIFADVFPGKS